MQTRVHLSGLAWFNYTHCGGYAHSKMQEAFVRAGEEGSATPIHMFYRDWAVVVEIERHPRMARCLHEAEAMLASEDAQVRDAAVHKAGEIVRAAHRAIATANA